MIGLPIFKLKFENDGVIIIRNEFMSALVKQPEAIGSANSFGPELAICL